VDILDVDFAPPPEIIRQMVHYFTDPKVAVWNVALRLAKRSAIGYMPGILHVDPYTDLPLSGFNCLFSAANTPHKAGLGTKNALP
jgi:hypothetical protein